MAISYIFQTIVTTVLYYVQTAKDTGDDNFTHTFQYKIPIPIYQIPNTKVCMWSDVPDIITLVKFDVDRFRGCRSARI